MTIIEKIIAYHSGKDKVKPGEIVDVKIDLRLARDFGGASVIKNLSDNGLQVADPRKTFFTFDCNPTGSDQDYAANQHSCRLFARENNVHVFDINAGIGTHLAIDEGLAVPGETVVSTDSHANILGAIGCFGQGMGDRDIAAAWATGSVWFKVPETVRIILTGDRQADLSAKDIVLNLLSEFGAGTLLGYAVELYGRAVEQLTLDERITISSMATEMGAIILFIPPDEETITYCFNRSGREFSPVFADSGACYVKEFILPLDKFVPSLSLPGNPDRVVPVGLLKGTKIDSAFIGSCTNGRLDDLRIAASVLKGRKVAPGVVLKIVPATDEIWKSALEEALFSVFKESGALVSNAGCAGCASGQVGQNGPGEVSLSTGNRNFRGKQGKGDVYLVSPAVAAASAIAGYITTPDDIPSKPVSFPNPRLLFPAKDLPGKTENPKPTVLTGKIWLIKENNIDTDMIFHNRHLTVTELTEMGRYTFGNLEGWKDFSLRSEPGDIIITGKNFGAGSSRQQAVDCFKALKIQAIIAESFGAIYERNAINAGFPVFTCANIEVLGLHQRDLVSIDLNRSILRNLENDREIQLNQFSEVQMKIYQSGDLLKIVGIKK
jgi:3-isopropylmalate/(R)-2-methylmalate dehydratase large subunit